MKRRIAVNIILCIMIAVFLLAAPFFTAIESDKNTAEEDFTGIITVWHVVSFKAGIGSVSTLVKKCAKAVEEDHDGVFVEVHAMTVSEASRRIGNGELADVISFPLGWEYQDRLSIIDADMISPVNAGNLRECALRGDDVLALPYLMSGYVLASGSGIENNAPVACVLGKDLMDGTFVCGLREYCDALRKNEASDGVPASNYTDLVQLVGISAQIESEKLVYAIELVKMFIEPSMQSEIVKLCAFPTVIPEDQPVYADELTSNMYFLMEDACVPNSVLYARYADELSQLAQNAISGDESAQSELKDRVKELVNGKQIK